MGRLGQIVHIKANIADLEKTGLDLSVMKFKKMKKLLEDGRVMPGVVPERYAAMFLSYLRGNTQDQDVFWNIRL